MTGWKVVLAAVGFLPVAALTACGEMSLSEAQMYAQNQQDSSEMRERVRDLENTANAAMPVSGSATYAGFLGMDLETGGAGTALLGEGSVTANFGSGTVQGSFDNFAGGTDLDSAVAYDGEIIIAGDIGVRRPNSFDAGVTGTLDGQGQEIVVDTTIYGDFRGSDANAIGAATTDDIAASVDGEAVGGSIVVVGEQ